jgi:PIN domain nuclease of toxin-antitoxin system
MTRLVVDSWAWVEYLDGSRLGKSVGERISTEVELWTSILSLTEIVSKYRRKLIPEEKAIEAIQSLSRLGTPSGIDAIEAGRLHAEVRSKSPNFSLADSYVLQLARKMDAKVLTGDPDFKGIKETEFIE